MLRLTALILVILLLVLEEVIADEESVAARARAKAEHDNFRRRFDLCRLPMKRGNCGHGVNSWYYNHSLQKCVKFVYSLCGGNQNRFYKKSECQEFCNGIS